MLDGFFLKCLKFSKNTVNQIHFVFEDIERSLKQIYDFEVFSAWMWV